jgi:hypothetical protein
VSPYPFKTAQAHYEALLKETRERGGPRVYTKATVPDDWDGVYPQPRFSPNNDYWFRMQHVQVPTVLSLLTPEYQQRGASEPRGTYSRRSRRARCCGRPQNAATHMRSGAAIPSRSRPRSSVFAVSAHSASRESRISSLGALSTGQASKNAVNLVARS